MEGLLTRIWYCWSNRSRQLQRAKLDSLEDQWEALCPGFHQWFVRNRNSLFLETVIQSARLNLDSASFYYQKDIESIHASEKHYQNFKKESIEVALSNIEKIIQRKENYKIRALYGAGNYCLSPEYQKLQVASHVWHSCSEERKADHLREFRKYVLNIFDTFRMPANTGQKPSYQHRKRNITEPDIVVDRIEKSTSGNIQHCATLSTISFSDPRATTEKEFELHHRTNLPKVGLKMPGKLRQINKSWRSSGCVIVWKNYLDRQVDRKRKAKFGSMYLHFHENCLKNFSEIFYAPKQSFDLSKAKVDPKTHEKLREADKTLLFLLGIK